MRPVDISVRLREDRVEVAVKDSGTGLPKRAERGLRRFLPCRNDLYSTKKPFDFDAGGKGLVFLG